MAYSHVVCTSSELGRDLSRGLWLGLSVRTRPGLPLCCACADVKLTLIREGEESEERGGDTSDRPAFVFCSDTFITALQGKCRLQTRSSDENSVRLSVKRVIWDRTKESCAHILYCMKDHYTLVL